MPAAAVGGPARPRFRRIFLLRRSRNRPRAGPAGAGGPARPRRVRPAIARHAKACRAAAAVGRPGAAAAIWPAGLTALTVAPSLTAVMPGEAYAVRGRESQPREGEP